MPPALPTSWLSSRWLLAGGCLLLCLGIASSILFVDETEFVIVERLGRIVAVYDRPDDRGWQWKAPWPIDRVRRFDARLQLLLPPGREVFTSDRKNLVVQAALCWQIAPTEKNDVPSSDRPVVRFFRGLQSLPLAERRLESRMQAVLTTQFTQWSLADLLLAPAAEGGPPGPQAALIANIAGPMQAELDQQAGELESWTERLGIEIVDVRIRRLNFPAANQQAVFERMRSERQKIAERYRSSGQAESTRIRSQADRQAREALALADAEASRIQGEAEAAALAKMNAAYQLDPELAERWLAFETYRRLFNDQTTLVLSADHPLWRFLLGKPAAQSPASSTLPGSEPPAREPQP